MPIFPNYYSRLASKLDLPFSSHYYYCVRSVMASVERVEWTEHIWAYSKPYLCSYSSKPAVLHRSVVIYDNASSILRTHGF